MTRTALYRHYDAAGNLLYVGISDCLSKRDKSHSATSHWHHKVNRTETVWCSCREHAKALEAVAIRFEGPQFNVCHTPKHTKITPPDSVHPILPEIEEHLSKTGMSASYFGKVAVGNSELVPRLRSGGGLHFKTEIKLREYMAAQEASK